MTEVNSPPTILTQISQLASHRALTPVASRQIFGHQSTRLLKLTNIFHPLSAIILPTTNAASEQIRLEQARRYFACLLVPRSVVKRAYVGGIQDVPSLARLFNVSWSAVHIPLTQLGLIDGTSRIRSAV
jgi:hypothetical protein